MSQCRPHSHFNCFAVRPREFLLQCQYRNPVAWDEAMEQAQNYRPSKQGYHGLVPAI